MNTPAYIGLRQLLLSYNSFTYNNLESYNCQAILPIKHNSYADFLAGNSRTVCASTVRRAMSSISSRCSLRYPATSALANSFMASFHSTFAAFKCREPRSSEVSCKSCRKLSEQENSDSTDGRFTVAPEIGGTVSLGS